MLRWKGDLEVDGTDPRAAATCDRCGRRYNLYKLQWQFAYQGSTVPQNTRFLVCDRCLDPLNPQDMPYILPPDPLPIYNARPEPYMLDESGPTQDLELQAILNFVQNAYINISDNTDVYLLVWGGEELFWGAYQLEWSQGLVQPLDWGGAEMFWGGYEFFWG